MGRQLESLSDASNSIQYTYNENGIRTKKVVNGTTTTTYGGAYNKMLRFDKTESS